MVPPLARSKQDCLKVLRALARWKELALVPGARVRVREVREAGGMIELEVTGRRVVTAGAALEGLLVEVCGGGAHGD